jgi:hypothetical protein
LFRQEKRGTPLPPQRFMHVQFGRVIQPDPDDPIRIGIATGKITAPPGASGSHNQQARSICVIEFQPLALAAGGAGCIPASFPNGPLALGSFLASPITHLNGIAADGITHIRTYLSGGRIVQAALRDNVFSVAVPQAELPGKLVGYDAHNRVAAIVPLPGNAVAKSCPKATFTRPVSQLPAPEPWEKINLATLTVNRQHILGMTPQQVEAALGKPTVIRGNAQTTNGVPIPEFRYGGSQPSTFGLSVGFSKKGNRIFANSLSYQSPSLVDAKLGHVLRMQPTELQRAITRTYGSTLHVFISYGTNPGLGCTAVIKERNAASGISIGLNPYRPSRPHLDIRANAYG